MPCDHQSRTWLDPVPPELLTPVFAHGFNPLGQPPQLTALRSWQKRLVVGLEGTQSFTSPHLSCPQCARQPPATAPLPLPLVCSLRCSWRGVVAILSGKEVERS